MPTVAARIRAGSVDFAMTSSTIITWSKLSLLPGRVLREQIQGVIVENIDDVSQVEDGILLVHHHVSRVWHVLLVETLDVQDDFVSKFCLLSMLGMHFRDDIIEDGATLHLPKIKQLKPKSSNA